MNLYLLRHGIAEELGSGGCWDDAQRKLTPDGEKKLRQIVEGMRELDLAVELILTSPYTRALQTAEHVAKALKRTRLQTCQALVPGGSMQKLIQLLQEPPYQSCETMLVGHEPYLSELAALLVFGKPTCALQMKKGGLCKISVGKLEHGRCGMLEWLLTPKQLRALA